MRAARKRELLAWALGRLQRMQVAGPSMEPTLPAGTTVLVDPRAVARAGDVVVARHPEQDLVVIKRLDHLLPDGRVFLRGDGLVSTDSRDYGPLPFDALLGVVRCTFP